MTMHDFNDDEKKQGSNCPFKVLNGGAALHANANIESPINGNVIEVEFTEAKSESRCENGVCSVSWKPRRIA